MRKKYTEAPKKYHAQRFIHRTAGKIAHGFIFLALELYLAGTQRLSFGLLSKKKRTVEGAQQCKQRTRK